jgi:ATP-dependent Lhr-like helicase
MSPAPRAFHPITTQWFADRLGTATEVQRLAWPVIAAGGHVLVTAPTGTGKTLTAFLGAVDRLLTGSETGLCVLYVSPLKALNNDIRANLLVPLAELRERFHQAGIPTPAVEVMVRSGDTPEAERRRLRKHPPAILITTPESLNILLTQKGARGLFGNLKLVILDEIHAVVGSKRGTSLWTALERLVPLAGEFQRIGLSATVNPTELVARVLGGFLPEGGARPVTVVASPAAKVYDVKVVLPEIRVDEDEKVFWPSLALELRKWVAGTASTLIFANSRRACEKLARMMNENQDELVAYSHHGSLSKEIRHEVEAKLKAGELRALVATNSLELGIDIGDLDEVVLAETPRTAASAIQKVGRAGHRTGQVSRARLYPSHGLDLVEAAVIVGCIADQAVEPLAVPEGPLDVLAQTLLSALCAEPASADSLFALVTRAWPYRNLSRHAFDLVVDMLAGRYAGSRISELKPRIELDPRTGAWTAKAAVPFLLYSSGGTIPDRGYFTMRDLRTGSPLGELDEEFVWERSLGDRFALGAQVWKIAAISDQAVQVEPVDAPPHLIPFWKAEDQDRSWFLAERIGEFLWAADQAWHEGDAAVAAWSDALMLNRGFSREAADRLAATLDRERSVVGLLPHRWRVVIERVAPSQPGAHDRTDADQYVIHTFWGARINRPWAFALAQAWEDKFGYALETYPGDDQVLILVPPASDLEEALSLVTPANLEELLRRRLEATGFFGARFREGAGRALLLPKPGFDRRVPLWQTRMKAKRLLDAVSAFPEFPILLEAWRQCLKDEFDLEALRSRLEERSVGRIATHHCRTTEPSPFTEGLLWRQINQKMYEHDEPLTRRPSNLETPLWDQLLASDRPRLPASVVDDWVSRWGRTAPGYAPETPADLLDLLEVRIALSTDEWDALLRAAARDSGQPESDWKAALTVVQGAGRVGVASIAALWPQPQSLWLRWLEGRGPTGLSEMAAFWGRGLDEVEAWAASAVPDVVVGLLTETAQADQVCLARTWEQLVRRLRLDRRAVVPVRPAERLPSFLADWQGLVRPGSAPLQDRVGQLLGLPLAAELWESAVLPCREVPYAAPEFDRLFVERGLRWFGAGRARVVLGFPEDRHAWSPEPATPDEAATVERLFGSGNAAQELPFSALAASAGWSTKAVTDALWPLAWRGLVSATTFGPLRQGLRSGFQYDSAAESGRVSSRGFQRWAARSGSGSWSRWDQRVTPSTSLDGLEDAKVRARLVLDRYPVVFRSLLVNELPAFQWKALFPALRLMELSGEITGGLFFQGVPGLQFATPEGLRALEAHDAGAALWVQHAQDPSSLCGLGLEAFPGLPRRAAGTWLWWKGDALAGTLTAGAKKLEWHAEVGASLPELVKRSARRLLAEGVTHWSLEAVGGKPAADSALAPELVAAGFRPHGERLIYWKS